MDLLQIFECENCHYIAAVSAGPERGSHVATSTISCRQCQVLFDVVVCEDTSKSEQIQLEPHCPKDKSHTVTLWEHRGPCPKCGQRMKQR